MSESPFYVASASGCVLTLYIIYCMLVARTAGKGTPGLAAAVIPRSRAGSVHGRSQVVTLRFRDPSPPRAYSGLANMIPRALQKHEKEQAAALAAFGSSPTNHESRSSQTANPKYRSPLNPASTSALNAFRSSHQQQRLQSGIKRTASGLAKCFDGAFEVGPGSQRNPIMLGGVSPEKGKIVQVTQNDFIDVDDFDSDIDIDIEEPAAKKTVQYPRLPKASAPTLPTKPILYPTLPRQQQAQTTHADAVDSAYDNATSLDIPGSSGPLPWSSSPIEHHAPALKSSIFKRFTYDPTRNQHSLNGSPPPQLNPNTKRRTLPWHTQEQDELPDEDQVQIGAPTRHKVKSGEDATPLSKDHKKSPYLWNTSASAVKEQQKKHREENKKAIKRNEGNEEAIRKAKSSRQRPAKIFLSEEQQHVLGLVIDKKKSVFFTGSAGTGKSVLMREIISSLRKKYERESDRVAVTASTGLAACNIGGVTLHSFAGIGLGKEEVPELVKKIRRNQKAKHRWMRTKVLVVDEVSMVDAELFDKLEAVARQLRNNGRPFGGIQLVITGDFFQLPPVPDNGRVAKFAFDAATWSTTVEHTIGLHHVFRQKDPIFAGMLNEMREGRLQQSSIQAFRGLNRPLNFQDDLEATELFPTRSEVEVANQSKLGNLQGDRMVFEARDGGAIIDKAQRDKLLQNCMAPEQIVLKKGAQVMLIKNIDDGLVNGSLGRVIGFMDEQKFDRYTASDDEFAQKTDGTLATQAHSDLPAAEASKRKIIDSITTSSRQWPVARFILADSTSRDLLCQPESWKVELPNGEVQASRTQIPLILAWALSIHKAQGQTLERVKVDLGKVFEKGQAYVALSRATSMAGLQVLRFDPKKVVAHEKVRSFYSNLSRIELAEKNRERMEEIGGKKKSGLMVAEEYEKRFVEEEWPDAW